MAIKTYQEGTPFTGVIGRTTEESSPAWPEPPRPPEGAPNAFIWLLDDVGYGRLSSFGGLVETPLLDSLAASGLRYTNMHTTALCSPSRGCSLTGRNRHSIGLASITETSTGYPGTHSGRALGQSGRPGRGAGLSRLSRLGLLPGDHPDGGWQAGSEDCTIV